YENELATHGLEPSASIKQLRTTILAAPETVRDPGPGQPDRTGRRLVRPPAQLPAPIAAFTGRRTQLAWLDRLVAEDLGKELAICTVVGMAGVGKTALVLQWAHRVRDRFPDGQLFVDLRGYAAGPPVRPIDALAGFLRALGVPPEQAPVRLEQATALYRTLTAGRRMLIVLDNAREPDQVRPLLPGEPGCVVVVTSRDRLGGVVARDGASPLPLDVLAPDEAGRLLAGLLGAQRAAAQPGSVLDLARECAFLPLALRVAAATLVWQPARPIADYVAQLRVDRLTALAVDGDPDSTVGAAFDASYRVLPEPARELFCLLGLVPGPDVTAPAAAALAGVDEVQARALLDRLAAAHLLNHAAPGRYGWHDLLRCYAAERAQRSVAPADRQAALERLYGWYLYTVDGAADRLYPHMLRLPREQPAVGPPATQFADHAAALAWLEAERANLVAAVRAGASRLAAQIADALRGYFHLRRYTADWLAVAEAALAAAPDTRAEAAAEHSLGTAYRSMGDLTAALRHYVRALRLARAAGWREAEATTLGNLGIVCQGQGRLTAAVDHLTQALAVDRETGRQAGLANNLGNLGFVYRDQGRLDEAAIRFSEALELNRRTGSRHGQALALTGLGQVYRELGRLDEATARLTDAMRLYTEVGDRDGQGVVHHCQGAVDLDREKLGPAREHALAAIRLSRDTGDPRTEADALTVLSGTLNRLGRYHEAADGYRRVRELAEELALPRMQIEALTGLAEAELRLGDHDCARTCAELAAYRAARSGYRVLEAAARRVLDHASSADNRPRARMESNG
ncbi:MAG: tetratricopeptide repeat protein, partial [Micromonosporaceae bacterium]|nr:tetratricopeptide repeat protein [Micromonosporaceae bacterium]